MIALNHLKKVYVLDMKDYNITGTIESLKTLIKTAAHEVIGVAWQKNFPAFGMGYVFEEPDSVYAVDSSVVSICHDLDEVETEVEEQRLMITQTPVLDVSWAVLENSLNSLSV